MDSNLPPSPGRQCGQLDPSENVNVPSTLQFGLGVGALSKHAQATYWVESEKLTAVQATATHRAGDRACGLETGLGVSALNGVVWSRYHESRAPMAPSWGKGK